MYYFILTRPQDATVIDVALATLTDPDERFSTDAEGKRVNTQANRPTATNYITGMWPESVWPRIKAKIDATGVTYTFKSCSMSTRLGTADYRNRSEMFTDLGIFPTRYPPRP